MYLAYNSRPNAFLVLLRHKDTGMVLSTISNNFGEPYMRQFYSKGSDSQLIGYADARCLPNS